MLRTNGRSSIWVVFRTSAEMCVTQFFLQSFWYSLDLETAFCCSFGLKHGHHHNGDQAARRPHILSSIYSRSFGALAKTVCDWSIAISAYLQRLAAIWKGNILVTSTHRCCFVERQKLRFAILQVSWSIIKTFLEIFGVWSTSAEMRIRQYRMIYKQEKPKNSGTKAADVLSNVFPGTL